MAETILAIGESGSGKTTSLRNLDPKESFLIQVLNKPLPFPKWRDNWKTTKQAKGTQKKPNLFISDDSTVVLEMIKGIASKRPDVKVLIIDDFQYLMANEFMRRSFEKGFDKFTEIGFKAWSIIRECSELREDLIVVFLSHSETNDMGRTKCKTIGRMLDDKITLEGMFTIVLQTVIDGGKYYFSTQSNGLNTVKTPMGLFESNLVENDLSIIIQKIKEY